MFRTENYYHIYFIELLYFAKKHHILLSANSEYLDALLTQLAHLNLYVCIPRDLIFINQSFDFSVYHL